MKTIKLQHFFLLLFFGITISCSESILDTEIPSSITSGNFPTSEGDLRAMLTGLYDGLRDEYNRTTYGEDRGDSFNVGLIGTVSDAWAQNLNGGNGPNWRVNYNLINNINIIINTSEDIEFSSSSKKFQIVSEAYFMRAFTYFQLIKIWGDVPLLLSPVDQNTPLVGRTAKEVVMEQIINDLDLAIDLFPNDGFNGSKYMASKPAAYALLADVSLWNAKVLNGGDENFTTAITAVNSITGVQLLPDFGSIFDSKQNNEVIFAFFFDFNEQDGMYASTVTSRDVNVDRALNPDVPTSSSFNARHNYRPSDNIINLFGDSNDQRANRSFIPILTQDGGDADTDPDVLSISQNKFKGTFYNNDTYYDNDVIVYRWAEMLLFRAEANAALGNISQAVDDLNKIKERAGIPLYNGPLEQTAVELEILDERGRELFLELKRYWDLVRFHNGGTINIYNEVPNLSGVNIPLIWPVNNNIISENPLIEQTDGYE
ncbi:Starch-binding associating with outer membrane [Flavobacteriaceae bacterium MAR_2010_188]|nr:Starch-binding associating with outer membrane [Flavobacteriaceae bacterium MAR_2010_188]